MQKAITLAAAAVLLSACSSSGANPPSVPNVADLRANVLQLNVGTANLFGDTPGAALSGTNVVVTYRQPAGAFDPGGSAALVSSPSLTFPVAFNVAAGTPDAFSATIVGGPAPNEAAGAVMTATPQTPGATAVTTFGNDGGAFGLGLEPFNYVAPVPQAGVIGVPANVVPYPVPLYDAIVAAGGTDPNQFTPAGGLPAFDPSGNAAALAGASATGVPLHGISEGLDVFAVPPALGTYTLSVTVPANTGTVMQSQSAVLTNLTLLPPWAAGPPAPTVDATGAVTAPVVLPAGVSEAYIQLVDYGPTVAKASSCTGATPKVPVYHTVVVKASGTAAFPASTVCTAAQNAPLAANAGLAVDGDAFTTQAIGFNYGAYEASYPSSNGVTAPSLAGSGASTQADITVSSKGLFNLPAAGGIINRGGGAVLPAGAADPQRTGRRPGT